MHSLHSVNNTKHYIAISSKISICHISNASCSVFYKMIPCVCSVFLVYYRITMKKNPAPLFVTVIVDGGCGICLYPITMNDMMLVLLKSVEVEVFASP